MSHMKSITPYFPTPPNKFQLNWFSFFHNTQLRHVCDFNYPTSRLPHMIYALPHSQHTQRNNFGFQNQKCRRAECVISTVQYTIEEGLIYLSPGF